jgi:hypothetical protein
MDYIQFFGLSAAIIGTLVWFHRDLKQTIAEIREDVKIQDSRIDQQTIRMGQLYTMFIDLMYFFILNIN